MSMLSTCWPYLKTYSRSPSICCCFLILPTIMLLSAATAAWCSLLWARAALNRLCELSAQHCSTASRQGSGSCSSWLASCLAAILQQ